MTRNELQSPPRRTRWLIGLTAALALFQAGAVLQALNVPAEVAAQVSLPLIFQVVISAVWAVLTGWASWQLWHCKPSAGRNALWVLAGFSIYSLFRLLLFSQADYDRERLPFLSLLTAIILVMLAAALRRQRAKTDLNGDLTP